MSGIDTEWVADYLWWDKQDLVSNFNSEEELQSVPSIDDDSISIDDDLSSSDEEIIT